MAPAFITPPPTTPVIQPPTTPPLTQHLNSTTSQSPTQQPVGQTLFELPQASDDSMSAWPSILLQPPSPLRPHHHHHQQRHVEQQQLVEQPDMGLIQQHHQPSQPLTHPLTLLTQAAVASDLLTRNFDDTTSTLADLTQTHPLQQNHQQQPQQQLLQQRQQQLRLQQLDLQPSRSFRFKPATNDFSEEKVPHTYAQVYQIHIRIPNCPKWCRRFVDSGASVVLVVVRSCDFFFWSVMMLCVFRIQQKGGSGRVELKRDSHGKEVEHAVVSEDSNSGPAHDLFSQGLLASGIVSSIVRMFFLHLQICDV
jgi:hypothetical protein